MGAEKFRSSKIGKGLRRTKGALALVSVHDNNRVFCYETR